MPQSNRGFSKSKMNKDFDERIVPEGEYRDALNIQISASEDSDVGSAQTLLGNTLISQGLVPTGSMCVGSIAYGKEDKIYYLVAGPKYTSADQFNVGCWKDYIIEYDIKTKIFKYVFVDIYRAHYETTVPSVDRNMPVDNVTPLISNARTGMFVNGFNNMGNQIIFTDLTQMTEVTEALTSIEIYSTAVDYNNVVVPAGTILQCTQKRVLNFIHGNLITGINIIDNLLFWTDNYSEPKKININRSIGGTGGSTEVPAIVGQLFTGDNANYHTRLVVTPDEHHGKRVLRRNMGQAWFAEEENVTVIRKNPRTPPMLEMSQNEDGRDGDDTFSTTNDILGDPTLAAGEESLSVVPANPLDPFEAKKVGDTIGDIHMDNPVHWKVGDTIIFNQQQSVDSDSLMFSAQGFVEHDVRATIKAPVPVVPATGPWHMTIQSIDGEAIDTEQKTWNLRLEQKKPMFEFKFVRFAYRYKYEDGEYSPISPWSELAFIPGEYDFLPKKGYNLGMTNRLRQLKIKNYATELTERPSDVVEIDLLYKDESSPNIYTVETIKMTDGWTADGELLWPDSLNGPNIQVTTFSRGEYEVTSELIHKAVPASQSLRHWDNVPRVSLAQSISANRLVYGNYVQNFNLLSKLCGDKEIKPLINVSIRSIDAPLNAPEGTSNAPLNGFDTAAGFPTPGKTVRSLRTYQVGVVYGDVYGRETPVLAGHGGTGSYTVEKPNSSTLNKLTVDIATPAPDFAYYYKLFIKETTNEYYNLTMDRWYDAEDGNIWLSFASSDRNKVDLETSLVLKKKHNVNEAVTDPARYKILAIENEAPDFIKTNIKSLGVLDNNGVVDIGTSANGFPAPDNDKIWFKNSISGYSEMFDGLSIGAQANTEITRMRNAGTLYVRMRNVSGVKSDWYQVSQYTRLGTWHKIKTRKVFGDDMAFCSQSGDFSTAVTGLQIELAEFKVEDLKEFEGRFFVKIYKDLVLQQNLMVTPDPQVRVRMAMQVGYWNVPRIDTPGAGNTASETKWELGRNIWGEMHAIGGGAEGWCTAANNSSPRDKIFFYSAYGGELENNDPTCATNAATSNWTNASTKRWHIDNLFVRGTKDDDCSFNWGNPLFPCCDRDCMENVGCNMGRGIHNGGARNLGGLEMDLGYITDNEDYNFAAADQEFNDLMLTAGTLFRWREDPDEIIYKTTGGTNSNSSNSITYGRHHTWHDKSSKNLGNNKRRIRVAFEKFSQPGVGFGTGPAGYHPIGGKDYTKIAGREEMGYWGGRMVDGTNAWVLNATVQGSACNEIAMPLPPGYGVNKAHHAHTCGDSYTSAELYTDESTTPGAISGNSMTVTKKQQGCRYRKHMAQFHHIEIVEPIEQDESDWSTDSPAVWETEPKEDSGLDIYYEASPALPIVIDYSTNEMFAPWGSVIVDQNGNTGANFVPDNHITGWSDNAVSFQTAINFGPISGTRIGFMRPDGFVTYAIINETGITNSVTVRFANDCPAADNWTSDAPHNQPTDLSWFNAYAFGNGIESDRIRDDFNANTIANGVKASSTVAEQYKEERRKTGLIHSGLYNSISGINDLNQFLTAEKITKDMNPEYGSIQKLHTRDGDIVVMHEDKIMKVLADKDALYNADGSSNVALSKNFLGSDRPFATKYGISTNPESFATDLYGRIYFTDRARGSVLRLSGDGITNISDYGMKDWFNDHLNPHTTLALGTFDTKKNLYNLSIEGYTAPKISDDPAEDYDGDVVSGCACVQGPQGPQVGFTPIGLKQFPTTPMTDGLKIASVPPPQNDEDEPNGEGDVIPPAENLPGYEFFQQTVSFSEKSKGWISFKSFFPESGLSINNEYYTWRDGDMYHHHSNSIRNNFYGVQYDSTIDLLFNDAPELVKSFTTLNYEGSQSRITPHVAPGGLAFSDHEYYNLTGKDGWYVESSITDLQSSGELEFKNKEGKWFSYMKGVSTTLSNLDEREFSVQGIGVLGDTLWVDPGDPPPPPVPDPYCLNISPQAACDEAPGCTDPDATNYDPTATSDDGSCTYPGVEGCTNPVAWNYDPNATIDDNSCCLLGGCTDPLADNYFPYYCFDDGSCSYGCQWTYEIGGVANVDPTTAGGSDGTIYFEWESSVTYNGGYQYEITDVNTQTSYVGTVTDLGNNQWSFEANNLPGGTFEISIIEDPDEVCSFVQFYTLVDPVVEIVCNNVTSIEQHDAVAENWYDPPHPPGLGTGVPFGDEAAYMATDAAFGLQNTDCGANNLYVWTAANVHYTCDGFRINLIWGKFYPVEWLEAIHKQDIINGGTGFNHTPQIPNLGCNPPTMSLMGNAIGGGQWQGWYEDDWAQFIDMLNDLEDNAQNLIFGLTPFTLAQNIWQLNTDVANRGGACSNWTAFDFALADTPKCL